MARSLPVSRRNFLTTTTGLRLGQSTGSTLRLRQSELPLEVEIEHSDRLVSGAYNLIIVHATVTQGGILGPAKVNNPAITVRIQNARIETILPGNFPSNVHISAEGTTAKGEGIRDPWKTSAHATFGLIIVPQSAEPIRVNTILSGRSGSKSRKVDSYKFSLPVTGESREGLTRTRLIRAAETRAAIADGFETFLSKRDSFADKARSSLQKAVLDVCWMSTRLLTDNVVGGEVSGVGNDAAEYAYMALEQYHRIFEYTVNNHTPNDPTKIGTVESSAFGPPFFSEMLSEGQNLVEDFLSHIRYYEPRVEWNEDAARVQLTALAADARREAAAWKAREDDLARELLGYEIFYLTGVTAKTDDRNARKRLDQLVDPEQYNTGYAFYEALDDGNIPQRLFEIWGHLAGDP